MTLIKRILCDGRYTIVIDAQAPKNAEPGWLIDRHQRNASTGAPGIAIAAFGQIDGEWCCKSFLDGANRKTIYSDTDRMNCIIKLWQWKKDNFNPGWAGNESSESA